MENLNMNLSSDSLDFDNNLSGKENRKDGSFSSGLFLGNLDYTKKKKHYYKNTNTSPQELTYKYNKFFSQSGKFTKIARIRCI